MSGSKMEGLAHDLSNVLDLGRPAYHLLTSSSKLARRRPARSKTRSASLTILNNLPSHEGHLGSEESSSSDVLDVDEAKTSDDMGVSNKQVVRLNQQAFIESDSFNEAFSGPAVALRRQKNKRMALDKGESVTGGSSAGVAVIRGGSLKGARRKKQRHPAGDVGPAGGGPYLEHHPHSSSPLTFTASGDSSGTVAGKRKRTRRRRSQCVVGACELMDTSSALERVPSTLSSESNTRITHGQHGTLGYDADNENSCISDTDPGADTTYEGRDGDDEGSDPDTADDTYGIPLIPWWKLGLGPPEPVLKREILAGKRRLMDHGRTCQGGRDHERACQGGRDHERACQGGRDHERAGEGVASQGLMELNEKMRRFVKDHRVEQLWLEGVGREEREQVRALCHAYQLSPRYQGSHRHTCVISKKPTSTPS